MKIVIDIPEGLYDMARTSDNPNHIIRMAGFLCYAVANGTPLPKRYGRLIDADAYAEKIKEISTKLNYDRLEIDNKCTVEDVLEAVIHDLKGTALYGFELCPTIIEADKDGEQK